MKKSLPFFFVMLLSGCSLAPDYQRPQMDMPVEWSGSSELSSETQIAVDWWKSFDSEELNTLMMISLAENNDLRAAVFRIEQARADLKIAGASLLPTVDGAGGVSWAQTNPANGNASSQNAYSVGPALAYEVDLFGANRSATDAAAAAYQGSQFNHDALALVVMGDVANNYFTALNLKQRSDIARENLKNARDVLGIVQARYDVGAVTAVDLAQQKAAVANGEAALAALEEREKIVIGALAVLLGKSPQSLELSAQNLDGLSVPRVTPVLPSDLMIRRPDIRSAESSLQAANANIGVARAALFPSVSLGADWSIGASPISNPAVTALSLVSALAVPIFKGGRLVGGVEKATARQSELVENYRKTVLTSFQEVESAQASVKAAALREQSYKTAMTELRGAYDLSLAQYKGGAIDFQTLLDSQQSLFSAEDSYAQAQLAMLSSAVNLYKALGGGWIDAAE